MTDQPAAPVLSDEQKIRQFGKDAVWEILSRYAAEQRFYNTSYKLLKCREDAEDALNDAFLLAVRKWEQFRGDSKFSTWFTRIVITCSLMSYRKRRPTLPLCEPAISTLHSSKEVNAEDAAIEAQRLDRLLAAVSKIAGDRERRALKLTLKDGKNAREVAEILGVPLGTAKTFILRAKNFLREELDGKV